MGRIALAKAQANLDRRWEILQGLEIAEAGLEDLLRALLAAPDPMDRWVGSSLLVMAASSGVAERRRIAGALLPGALEHVDPEEADMVGDLLAAVGHLNDASLYPMVVPYAEHGDPNVREAVAFGLKGMEGAHPDALAALLRLARDEDADVRDWAVFALGEGRVDGPTGSPQALEIYRECLNDEDPDVREGAQRALALLGDVDMLREVIMSGHASPGILEAARRAADPRLVAPLQQLEVPDSVAAARLSAALNACEH